MSIKFREYYLKKESDCEILYHTIMESLTRRQITNKDQIVIHAESCRVSDKIKNLAKSFDFIKIEDGVKVTPLAPKKIFIPNSAPASDFVEDSIEPITKTKFKVVISMTSWKGRLWRSAVPTLRTLLSQKMTVPYKVVMVLSSDEIEPDSIPDEIHEFEKDSKFELLWVKQNIRSHKKLMPVLRRYPNLPIIISDDDCMRSEDWAQRLYDEYLKEPNMIHSWACGSLTALSNNNLIFDFNKAVDHPSILNRAANGNVGTLYPPHIFDSVPEFFDPKLYMRLSPTSDETWQWAWQAMLGIKTKWIVSNSRETRKLGRIDGVQDVALFNTNKDEYSHVYLTLLLKYPKLKEILQDALKSEVKPLPKIIIKA